MKPWRNNKKTHAAQAQLHLVPISKPNIQNFLPQQRPEKQHRLLCPKITGISDFQMNFNHSVHLPFELISSMIGLGNP